MDSPYQFSSFVPQHVRSRIIRRLGLQNPDESLGQCLFISEASLDSRNRAVTVQKRIHMQGKITEILLRAGFLTLHDPSHEATSSHSHEEHPVSRICRMCQSLQLAKLALTRTVLIKSDHSIYKIVQNSRKCECCKFIAERILQANLQNRTDVHNNHDDRDDHDDEDDDDEGDIENAALYLFASPVMWSNLVLTPCPDLQNWTGYPIKSFRLTYSK